MMPLLLSLGSPSFDAEPGLCGRPDSFGFGCAPSSRVAAKQERVAKVEVELIGLRAWGQLVILRIVLVWHVGKVFILRRLEVIRDGWQ